jgi:hypothetical protein
VLEASCSTYLRTIPRTLAYSGFLWRGLASFGVLCRTLVYLSIRCRTLAYARCKTHASVVICFSRSRGERGAKNYRQEKMSSGLDGAPVARAVLDFFTQCVKEGTTDVFVDLRDWGLCTAVLALLFHDSGAAYDALLSTLSARDDECLERLPSAVAEMMEAARQTLTVDLDAKLRHVANHALGRGTHADGVAADEVHRAVMHLLVAFMGLGLTAADVTASAAKLGMAASAAKLGMAAGPQVAEKATQNTKHAAHSSTHATPKQAGPLPKVEPTSNKEPRASKEPGAKAVAVPADVKVLAEAFVRAAHQGTLEDSWPKLRAGVRGLRPADARALFFCATRTGVHAGKSYWERVFACDLVDARTVLDMLRAFDGLGVPLFVPLEHDVRLTDLAERRAKREDAFAIIVAWLQAARGPIAVQSANTSARFPPARNNNIACPFSTTLTDVGEPARDITALACVVCGRTSAELLTGTAVCRCGRCGQAWYCSVVCQKWHWRRWHKTECKSAESAQSVRT